MGKKERFKLNYSSETQWGMMRATDMENNRTLKKWPSSFKEHLCAFFCWQVIGLIVGALSMPIFPFPLPITPMFWWLTYQEHPATLYFFIVWVEFLALGNWYSRSLCGEKE
tara:strand:+ start:231 stop:563 length:333 start_codon:yes stop_codon:yes gene_type:complete